MVWQSDSFSKIANTYFAAITTQPFDYKGKTYNPRPLKVTSHVFRPISCPPMCGGCCQKASLDYLPEELARVPFGSIKPWPELREVEFNGRKYTIYSDTQTDNDDKYCRHRREEDGRCDIHANHPFSCDFECIKFYMTKKPGESGVPNQLLQRPFPRKWSYIRVDGGKGGLCESQPVTDESVKDAARRLRLLRIWADYFNVSHCLDEIIEYVASGPHGYEIVVNRDTFSDDFSTMQIELSR